MTRGATPWRSDRLTMRATEALATEVHDALILSLSKKAGRGPRTTPCP